MWFKMQASAERMEAVLYLLCSSLYSALEDSEFLTRGSCEVPDIGPGLGTTEIISRLADFRRRAADAGNCEALLVARINRARWWARELVRFEPHMRGDIQAFLVATNACEHLGERLRPDAYRLFDGAGHPGQFLTQRLSPRSTATAALGELSDASSRNKVSALPSYFVGGEVRMDDLQDACETLLARLAQHYGWEEETPLPTPKEGGEAIAEAEEIGPEEAVEAAASEPASAATGVAVSAGENVVSKPDAPPGENWPVLLQKALAGGR